jgi:hypothetical protein
MKKCFPIIFLALMVLVPKSVFGYSVSPGIIDLESELGGVIQGQFSVINSSDIDETLYLSTKSFSASENDGVPEFGEASSINEFANWITFESSSFQAVSHSKTEMPFTVTVPGTAPAGGYYAAILVSQAPSEIVATNGATIHATIAILCFLTVNGDSVESLEILSVDSSFDGISSTLSGDISLTVQNQGTIHMVPDGEVVVEDVFGRQIYTKEINETSGRILPASKRTFSVSYLENEVGGYWSQIKQQANTLAIGPISVTSKIVYGSENNEIRDIQTFWYLPWQLLSFVFILVSILSIIYRILLMRQKRIGKLSN